VRIPRTTALNNELRRFGGKDAGAALPAQKERRMSNAFDDDAIAAIDKESNAGTDNGHGIRATLPASTTQAAAPPGYRQMHPLDLYLENEPGGGPFFEGEFFNFNGQTGEQTIGREKHPVGATVAFHVHVDGMAIGHVKIVDKKIVDREIGLVADGYIRKPREELDDYDMRRWPRDRGEPQDPWRPTTCLPMRNMESGEMVIYGPIAPTQLKAIKDFIAVVRRSDRDGRDPMVLIGSRNFKNQSGGTSYVPTFTIVGWEYWNGQPAPELPPIAVPRSTPTPAATKPKPIAAPRRGVGDMDDDIPF
jgi:hypothetical protein